MTAVHLCILLDWKADGISRMLDGLPIASHLHLSQAEVVLVEWMLCCACLTMHAELTSTQEVGIPSWIQLLCADYHHHDGLLELHFQNLHFAAS